MYFFPIIFTIILFFLSYHYYFTIILIIIIITSDYIRVLHSNFQELADSNSCTMCQAMTDKSLAAPAQLWMTRQASFKKPCQHIQLNERYYAIASRRKPSLLSHEPNSYPFLLYYAHYITINSLLYQYYLLLYFLFHKSELEFGCIFIAENLPIRTSTAGDHWAYNKSIRDSNIKLQQAISHPVSCSHLPTRIGLAYVHQPMGTQFRFELSHNPFIVAAMVELLSYRRGRWFWVQH